MVANKKSGVGVASQNQRDGRGVVPRMMCGAARLAGANGSAALKG